MISILFVLFLLLNLCECCYFIQCTDRPECPYGFSFTGNFSFDGCFLIPRFVRFECCLNDIVPTTTSNGIILPISIFLTTILFIKNFFK